MRGSHVESSFVGASFESGVGTAETASASGESGGGPVSEVDRRVFRTYLRADQADRVAELVSDVGGNCYRSKAGSPEKLVATVLAGTTAQFRELVTALSNEGLGLRRVANQLDEQLDPEAPSREAGLGPLAGDETAVMGILNVTPDSFHDGGEYEVLEAAIDQAETMVEGGADVIDVGGESTRPGADPVPAQEEIDRVVPVIEALSDLDVPISVDTWKAAVADAALDAGADIINDVSGLTDPEMPFVVADHDAALVLMHSLSIPVDPDSSPIYDDVVEDVLDELGEQVLRAERAGIDRDRIVIDPGCGFGKSPAESYELIDRAEEFRALGCPVLIGHSRKSMYKAIDYADDGRLTPTIAGTALAADRGADVVRVHDVRENVAAIRAADGRVDPDS